MKSRLERIEKNEVALEIEVPQDRVQTALEKAYKKVARRVTVPGFRKGRVPRPVLESFFGKEILYEEALEEVIPAAYEQAVQDMDIQPVTQPDIDVVQMEDGKPLIFKAKVVVKPEVTLGQVEGIKVTTEPVTITDEDVENRLQSMRERYARLVEIEEDVPVQMGDVVDIDFEGYIDGEPFPGGKGENYSLELGSNTFIPGFEEQLVGAKIGDEKEIKVRFPDDYANEDLAGKEAMFKVKIKEAKRRELNPLNDEFAQEVSEFDTLEELRDDIRRNLTQIAEQRTRQMMKEEVVEKALESAQVDIPDEMINTQVGLMIERLQERLAYQGMTLQNYLDATGNTIQKIREDYHPEAEKIVRRNLVLEAIAKQMGLEATEEDFDREIRRVAEDFGVDIEEMKKRLARSRDEIEYGIRLDKAVDFLLEKADIVGQSEQEAE